MANSSGPEGTGGKPAMPTHKLMFVLPNLFTVSSIFCGFYAVTLCCGTATPTQLYQAALAILFAAVFDGMDGRVARMTRTQSEFGMELDSLADVCSFGMAPALLAWKWSLHHLGMPGLVISFMFAACGALRLARFNVLAHRAKTGASDWFVGLPIPLAAGFFISLVIAHYLASGAVEPTAHELIAAVVVALSLLMVSTVKYRTFKHAHMGPGLIAGVLGVIGMSVAVAVLLKPAYVLVALFTAYLAMGLVEAVVGLVRRKPGLAPAEPGELEDDEDESAPEKPA